MPMKPSDIVDLIQAVLPDARIKLRDMLGDRDHYEIEVISKAFQGKTRIQQHQMIYQALGEHMGGELHALSIHTHVPQED
jgi:stress-induced morphogen